MKVINLESVSKLPKLWFQNKTCLTLKKNDLCLQRESIDIHLFVEIAMY